jgi:hypothetical protein
LAEGAMNVTGTLDFVFSVKSALERGGCAPELVDTIADALAAPDSVQYVTRIDALAPHHAVDLTFTAERARKEFGICVRVLMEVGQTTCDGCAGVQVKPTARVADRCTPIPVAITGFPVL